MAKYDRHEIIIQVGKDKNTTIELRTSVLFEDGDNIKDAVRDATAVAVDEAARIQSEDYLKSIDKGSIS